MLMNQWWKCKYLWRIGCGGHFVFRNCWKINTSQAYATLYLYKKFGNHNFSCNWSDVVKMLSQQNLQVPSRRPFCFNLIGPKKQKLASIMITHLHIKSGDDSLNGIAVIGQTIFMENWLWRPSCFSEIAENNTSQTYATLYPYMYKKIGDDIFITFPLTTRQFWRR